MTLLEGKVQAPAVSTTPTDERHRGDNAKGSEQVIVPGQLWT